MGQNRNILSWEIPEPISEDFRAGENAVVFWSPDYIPMEHSDQFDKLVNCLDRLKQNDFVEQDVAVIFANDPTPYTIDQFLPGDKNVI
jgi:hypothetical protein